jgi:hypothetical protein
MVWLAMSYGLLYRALRVQRISLWRSQNSPQGESVFFYSAPGALDAMKFTLAWGILGQLWYALALIFAPGHTKVDARSEGLGERTILTTPAHISSTLYASWQVGIERRHEAMSCWKGALCSVLCAV